MGLIRTKSKKKTLINKNRLNALYSRMRDNKIDFDGLHLVESIHDEKFVKYVEELENERQNDDFEDISSDEEPEAVNGNFNLLIFFFYYSHNFLEQNCVVCKSKKPNFIYNKCSHLVLCSECAGILIINNNFVCVLCRAMNTKIKQVYM